MSLLHQGLILLCIRIRQSQFYQNVGVPEGIATRLSRILGGMTFPKASSRASAGTAGTNDGEAPATRLHFGFSDRWAGDAIRM